MLRPRWRVMQDLGGRSGVFEVRRTWRRQSAERQAARCQEREPGRFTIEPVPSQPDATTQRSVAMPRDRARTAAPRGTAGHR